MLQGGPMWVSHPWPSAAFTGTLHFIGNSELWLDGSQGMTDSEEMGWLAGDHLSLASFSDTENTAGACSDLYSNTSS